MNQAVHRACACSGFACVILFLLGFWVVAGFVPPPSPANPAIQTAWAFHRNQNEIRAGMIISGFAAALLGPWVAAISVHLRRIEGRYSPLAQLQLGFGMLLVLEFIFPMMIWQTATFRADRSSESVQLLNDLAWIPFEAVTSTAVIQCVAIGVAILSDRRDRPVFPRWVAYLNFWVALAFAGGTLNVFFKSGPLAWPGVIAWWIPLAAFPVWLVTMTVQMLRRTTTMVADDGSRPTDPAIAALAAELAEVRHELALVRRTATGPG